jgi:hypothetical protein
MRPQLSHGKSWDGNPAAEIADTLTLQSTVSESGSNKTPPRANVRCADKVSIHNLSVVFRFLTSSTNPAIPEFEWGPESGGPPPPEVQQQPVTEGQ